MKIRKTITSIFFILGCAGIGANDILKKADSFRSFSSNGFSFDYVVKEKNEETEMTVFIKNQDASSVITLYKKPVKLSGRRIFVENSLFWLFDTNMNSPVRISAQQMLSGQASAGDIINISFEKLYDIVSETQDSSLQRFELEAKNKKSGNYPKIILKTQSTSYKPVCAELYAPTGVKLKIINYNTYTDINGKEMLTGFSIINCLNNSETNIEMKNFSTKTLPDRYFSKEGIKTLK